ncbi:hypothetical protein [Nocardia wallacei]|uniref:hypothetical protein n=1 Tax=Nocardia wallacei TaxID=480035 RepID=UPI00245704C8|nr:hypothetical protein [Nocardia wallacei]
MVLLRTYRCVNPGCPDAFHYSMVCPRPPGPRTLTDADMRAMDRYAQAARSGDFDLRRTPSYMRKRDLIRRERDQARARYAAPGPGHGWVLVLVPVALLLVLVMGALLLGV